jgi:hypothetical protein
MDCVADQLVHGTRFRALTVVDIFTKECLAIEVGQSLKGKHVDRGQLWGNRSSPNRPALALRGVPGGMRGPPPHQLHSALDP